MIYSGSLTALIVFLVFVGLVLALSFWLGKRARSASGYFAAHGQVGWFVNGVAFAGDYLSAASFLGICGMIAFYGYDGFLYSIGYLAGWVVALFVIAEPVKRLGRFTFADALDSKFQSRGIKLAAAISTLVVSIFYLIPQMVGAGALIKPLLGLQHEYGVLIVGVTVTLIVVTAGMVSTTWVQFIKGSLLVIFCLVLCVMILHRGLHVTPADVAMQPQTLTVMPDGTRLANGAPQTRGDPARGLPPHDLRPVGNVIALPGGIEATGPLSPVGFLATLHDSRLVVWDSKKTTGDNHAVTTTFTPRALDGKDILIAGASPTFKGVRSDKLADKLDFISLMLALFCGTASLPHILIRYYTVKDAASARKSTIVGIASIGCFYVLTLFLGLGAMTSGTLDVTNSNMAAPLLARSFGELPFALVSAIAFTTVLGTVSGLIMAASGAVAHDIMENVLNIRLNDHAKVGAARWAAVGVSLIAMWLGIKFEKLNVTFLVGWAFNVAASANLPALVMLLFWSGTTKRGVAVSILVGMVSSLAWLLLSAPAYKDLYGLDPARAIAPFSQPGLVTIPLSFLTLILVSLATRSSLRPAQDRLPDR
ncbi:MAG: cation acetate symporter [Lentisphaerae bacterium]|nr:cation acetate symporter [Lentisphaerota bacterium]